METILLFVTLALWSVGFLLLDRLRRCAGASAPELARSVSVVIPARNEEHNLPALLRSLASQPVKPHEIVVMDDGSTHRTVELADHRVRPRVAVHADASDVVRSAVLR